MAYGQTGAGKTYSLSSIAADAIGMIPRAAAEVFSHIEQVGGGGGWGRAEMWGRLPCRLQACANWLCAGGEPRPTPLARYCLGALQDPTHQYQVYMSYVQLYMELIQVGGCWTVLDSAGQCWLK